MNLDDLISNLDERQNEPCYPQRIASLRSRGWSTKIIENGIADSLEALSSGTRSFVIYGEPQSGKTEFMIALVCKLLDLGKKTIFIVMNDNTELENQNFDRFHAASELNPTPIRDYQLKDLSQDQLKVSKKRIIFCRKNSKNLQKLIEFARFMDDRVVIDDEADYATPNAKINKDEQTAINKYLGILGELNNDEKGLYIGVTATPARLDLNNTFANDASKWVFLDSHSDYKGRAFFFPLTEADAEKSNYNLVKLPDDTDDPRLLRHAVFRFLLRVAILNLHPDSEQTAYSMLIHTAGTINDHEKDQQDIQKIIGILSNRESKKFRKYAEELLKIANDISADSHLDFTSQEIWEFVMRNIGKNDILVINHKNDSANVKRAGQPKALFTFAIGGNIVSRGLTFENLLTFFFSRNVKRRLQQNTYIQRARMFGYRPFSEFFELCVPETLLSNWADCFQEHEASLQMAKAGNYLHFYGSKTQVVDRAAMDTRNVQVEASERTVGNIFHLSNQLEQAFLGWNGENVVSFFEDLINQSLLPEDALNPGMLEFLKNFGILAGQKIHLVLPATGEEIQVVESYNKYANVENIIRTRGGAISGIMKSRPEWQTHNHFLMPIKNRKNLARILYKPNQFGKNVLQNVKQQKAILC